MATFESGSFRDRTGRVAIQDGIVYRLLDERGLRDWRTLRSSSFFSLATERGLIINTEELKTEDIPEELRDSQWAACLRHQTIPLISYPYEWTFSMLKKAAQLQLDLLSMALSEGMILKDSSAFNIQWRGTRPVFIDIASFEQYSEGNPWVGYRQFCEHFLNPLMLQAYRGIPFQSWLRGNLEGISPEHLTKTFTLRDLVRPGVFTHVFLHSKLQDRYGDRDESVSKQLTKHGFGSSMIRRNLLGLQAVLEKLEWSPSRSEWSEYEKEREYTEQDKEAKFEFVKNALRQASPRLVWDLGCNTGLFTELASEVAHYVVGMDVDELCVERLFKTVREKGRDNILPLVFNVAQPSPGLGWRGLERRPLEARGRPDLVLCLALIHHLVVTCNLPVSEVVLWLRDLNASVVLEYVEKTDPMFRKLVRNKEDIYWDYEWDNVREELERSFEVIRSISLPGGTRRLLYLSPRSHA